MRFLVVLFVVGMMGGGFYLLIYHLKRFDKKVFLASLLISIIFGAVFFGLIFKLTRAQHGWCETFHTTTNYPPAELKTAMDYFEKGNFEYDTGNCNRAIEGYTKSIALNPNYAESYNNRAYTHMQMQKFEAALEDLNKAIELRPDYINALMNRADVYNYRTNEDDKAIIDYEKIIALTGGRGTAACNHMADAKYDGDSIFALFYVIRECVRW